jgi:uncharacterized protein
VIQTILDSGPLVAFYDRKDAGHQWADRQMSSLQPPLLTCEPVLTEACFLLQRGGGSPNVVLKAVRTGILKIAIEVEAEASGIEALMERYADVPMSLADACLVRLSEMHRDCRLITLDQHFRRYRRHGRQVIPVIAPW